MGEQEWRPADHYHDTWSARDESEYVMRPREAILRPAPPRELSPRRERAMRSLSPRREWARARSKTPARSVPRSRSPRREWVREADGGWRVGEGTREHSYLDEGPPHVSGQVGKGDQRMIIRDQSRSPMPARPAPLRGPSLWRVGSREWREEGETERKWREEGKMKHEWHEDKEDELRRLRNENFSLRGEVFQLREENKRLRYQ